MLLKEVDVKISLKTGFLLFISGLSMIVTPGGSGELIKSYYLKKKFNHKISKTFPTIIFERLFDLVSVSMILLIVSIILQNTQVSLFSILILSALTIILVSLRKRKIFNLLMKIIQKVKFLQKHSEGFVESYSVFHNLAQIKVVSKVLGISLVAWILDAIMIYFIFRGFNVDVGIIFSTFSMYISVLIGVLTMIPAGIGVTEISFVGILKNEGVDISIATSLIFMFRLVTIWFLTVLGFITTKWAMK